MSSLHYLTVQDILWIHFQITKKVGKYSYATLEEATFYQYAYGESRTLTKQAGRFLAGFAKLKPFDSNNDAVALVATRAFLSINGRSLTVTSGESAGWYKSASTSVSAAIAAVEAGSKEDAHGHEEHKPNVRGAIRAALHEYADAIAALTASNVA